MAGKENESNRLFEDEKVIEIEIERLRSFKDHPFKVNDDKEMHLLKDSIKQYGVLNPLIVRSVPDGVYEIISGHRRKYAAQQLGYRKVPVIIRVKDGYVWINVKCDPEWREFWRNAFESVIPAYHMNKTHWNSIILDGSVTDKDIRRMIGESYDLTKGKKK